MRMHAPFSGHLCSKVVQHTEDAHVPGTCFLYFRSDSFPTILQDSVRVISFQKVLVTRAGWVGFPWSPSYVHPLKQLPQCLPVNPLLHTQELSLSLGKLDKAVGMSIGPRISQLAFFEPRCPHVTMTDNLMSLHG